MSPATRRRGVPDFSFESVGILIEEEIEKMNVDSRELHFKLCSQSSRYKRFRLTVFASQFKRVSFGQLRVSSYDLFKKRALNRDIYVRASSLRFVRREIRLALYAPSNYDATNGQ